jgi:type IV pilus assembly protein PilY1
MNRIVFEGVLLVVLLITCGMQAGAQQCAESAPHSSTTVTYGDGPGAQSTILTPQRDGSVQAIDGATGAALWVFTPRDLGITAHGDRITDLRVLRFDGNGDGRIDIADGDKVWLYFGARQAGPFYYALDISDRDRWTLLWKASADSLDGLSDAWSTPTIARIRVGGTRQNGEHFVLVFGGGYHSAGEDDSAAAGAAETAASAATAREPSAGDRIFIVDAATGSLLWSAGADDGTREPDFVSDEMTRAFPARVAVLDTDGDAFADRMYAVDISGHVWRFDITNGQPPSSLVTGGILADLSGDPAPDDSARPSGDAPRFFNAPDVALIQPRGGTPYYDIAVGSRAFFYAIRDRDPFTHRSRASYDTAIPIRADALIDISASPTDTHMPPDAAGWTIALPSPTAASGTDEIVMGESVTADGVVLFTTFQPANDGACEVGASRVYAVRIDAATAGLDLNDDGEVTTDDLSMALPGTAPPGELRIDTRAAATQPSSPPRSAPGEGGAPTPDVPSAANDTDSQSTLTCKVGATRLPKCMSPGTTLRTWWQRPAVK